MKNISKITSIVALLMLPFISASAIDFSKNIPRDSIIIELDGNTRIVIFVKDKEGLDKLTQYDINAMLQDINMQIDSTKNNKTVLVIEDESGDKYLNDTTIVISEKTEYIDRDGNEVDDDEIEGDDGNYETRDRVKIRIGNYKFEIEGDDVDDIEDTLEDLEHEDLKIVKTTSNKPAPKTSNSFNVEIGINNYLQNGEIPNGDAAYSVKPFGSWYVGLSSIRKTHVGQGPFFIEWGGTFSWYNFKMDNASNQVIKTENGVGFMETAGRTGIKSKLTASFINLSLVPVLDFSHGTKVVKKYETGGGGVSVSRYKKQGLRIGFGGYLGYRLGSHSKFRYKENGTKDKIKEKGNFNLNDLRYGIRGQLGFKGMDLFINYDLNELFNAGKGPKLNAFTFGFIL